MANTSDGTCIANGLPASVMRQSVENKNILVEKGSIYVGTGNSASIEVDGVTYNVSRTSSLSPNGNESDGKILRYNSSTETGFEIIDPNDALSGFSVYSSVKATDVDLCASSNQDLTGINIEIEAGTGENASLNIPPASNDNYGVVKLSDTLETQSPDSAISANAIGSILYSNSSINDIMIGFNNNYNINDTGFNYAFSFGKDIMINGCDRSLLIGQNIISRSLRSDFSDVLIGYDINSNSYGSSGVKNNIVIGRNITTEKTKNSIAIGLNCSSNGITIGENCSGSSITIGENCSGNYGVSIGYNANSDRGCITIGQDAYYYGFGDGVCIIIGQEATANDASRTISIGDYSNTRDSYSIAIGTYAVASDDGAIAIGHEAEATAVNAMALGACSSATAENEIVLGNSQITALRCQVQTISQLSDSRVKESVELANTAICLADVNRLPVSRFKYKKFTGVHLDEHRTGFMADDVEKVFPKDIILRDETFPELDEYGNEIFEDVIQQDGTTIKKRKEFTLEKVKSISMAMGLPTLWGAVQELTKRLEALEQENRELRDRIDSL